MSEERYYQGVKQLAEADSVSAANTYLQQGYELLTIREKTYETVKENIITRTTAPIYILGKLNQAQINEPKAETKPTKIVPEDIQWNQGKTNKNYSWTWAHNRDGSEIPEYRELIEAIRKDGKYKENGYEYSLSQDGKFLQRVKL